MDMCFIGPDALTLLCDRCRLLEELHVAGGQIILVRSFIPELFLCSTPLDRLCAASVYDAPAYCWTADSKHQTEQALVNRQHDT